MPQTTFDKHRLERDGVSPHSSLTCGQSRSGGVGTSNSRRRSRFLGRVVVAHVQGSPKGGGALGLLDVPNTRLCSVPPQRREVHLSCARSSQNPQFGIMPCRHLSRSVGGVE